MIGLDARIASLEGTVESHTNDIGGIRDAITNMDVRVDRRFEGIDRRFDSIDRRFEAIDRRFEAIDRRFEAVDRRFEAVDQRFDAVDRRFDAVDRNFEGVRGQLAQLDQKVDARHDALDGKMSRQFLWLVGIQATTLATIVAGVIAALLTR